MNKVLVISYYWPPHAGVGVQRWLKFVKYMPAYGWDPTVFTPENASFDLQDASLNADIPEEIEVIRFPIWEPFSIFNKLTAGKSKQDVQQGLVMEKERKTWKDKLFIYIRGNLFIPDPRVFWVRPSVKFLADIITSQNITTVITTGPPHSIHLIGLKLKKRHGINWIADFRDPWSNWDLLTKLKVNKIGRYFHKKFENNVLSNADRVITVSDNLAKDLSQLGQRKVDVITNGVDLDQIEIDFTDTSSVDKFRISHIGLLNEMRDPEIFWKALSELVEEHPSFAEDLEINLAGIVSESILSHLKKSNLSTQLSFKSYLSHQNVFRELKSSALLLVILNKTDNAKWIIPGKLYEYLAARRRILLLGPENSNAAEILAKSKGGSCIDFDEKEKMKLFIHHAYLSYKSGDIVTDQSGINNYTRKKLTGDLCEILKQL